jgi:hypothetical protein
MVERHGHRILLNRAEKWERSHRMTAVAALCPAAEGAGTLHAR